MQRSRRPVLGLCPNHPLVGEAVLIPHRYSRRADVPVNVSDTWFCHGLIQIGILSPGSKQVYAHILLVRRPTKACHYTANAMLRCTVNWCSGLITIPSNTTHENQATIMFPIIRLAGEMMQSQLGGVNTTNKIRLKHLERWFNRILILCAV